MCSPLKMPLIAGDEGITMETEASVNDDSALCVTAIEGGDNEATTTSALADREKLADLGSAVSNGGDTDDIKETVDLKIIWNKNKYDLKIPLDGTGANLKERIHSLTGEEPCSLGHF